MSNTLNDRSDEERRMNLVGEQEAAGGAWFESLEELRRFEQQIPTNARQSRTQGPNQRVEPQASVRQSDRIGTGGDEGQLTADNAKRLYRQGRSAQSQGKHEEAQQLFWRSLVAFKQLGDQAGMAHCLYELARIAEERGEDHTARKRYQQSAETYEKLGDRVRERGNYDIAQKVYERSLQIYEDLGDQAAKARVLSEMVRIPLYQGKEEAQQLLQQSLERLKGVTNQADTNLALYLIQRVIRDYGTSSEAQKLLLRLLNFYVSPGGKARALLHLATFTGKQVRRYRDQRRYEQDSEIEQDWRITQEQQARKAAKEIEQMLAEDQGLQGGESLLRKMRARKKG